jgi:hypothetical protein
MSFVDFTRAYFAIPLDQYGKTVWAEKTPANAYGFEAALGAFEDLMVVHMIRDPHDVVASLIARGHSVFEAVGRWLLNTAQALKVRSADSYHEVRYEHLVGDPAGELALLMQEMSLSFEKEMLGTGNPNMHETDQLPGWMSSETAKPSKRSVGRFSALPGSVRSEILQAFATVRIRESYARKHGLEFTDCQEVARITGYQLESVQVSDGVKRKLKNDLVRHTARSLFRGHFFNLTERPLVLR